jgi:hypothetical protein
MSLPWQHGRAYHALDAKRAVVDFAASKLEVANPCTRPVAFASAVDARGALREMCAPSVAKPAAKLSAEDVGEAFLVHCARGLPTVAVSVLCSRLTIADASTQHFPQREFTETFCALAAKLRARASSPSM